jgi:hypothetical protein
MTRAARSDLVDIDVTLKRETDRAVLVVSDATGREAWVPRSQCEIAQRPSLRGHVLTLPERVAIEKELV